MGKITGFLEIERRVSSRRPVAERLQDWRELEGKLPDEELQAQGARCMDCGIPFCHKGCPLGNVIPDWNDLVYRGRWHRAIASLHATNNFPEFTGRVCPAPCEEACVLNINNNSVTIKQIEKEIVDHAFRKGWVVPQPASVRTGKKVAIVGSGPAGLACAQQLARAGHTVTVFERDDRIGGLLRYGIPDFKMEKHLLDRRIAQMEAEGVTFRPSTNVGSDMSTDRLRRGFDAIVLAGGARNARRLQVPGAELMGVHLALEFLPQQNKVAAGDIVPGQITAQGKRVVVLGGGDTGSDCVGTSNRQGAVSVHQFELLPAPPRKRSREVWPNWPMILRSSSSHEEGVTREWSINTKSFSGENGVVKKLHAVRLNWEDGEGGRMQMKEIPGSEFAMDVDLVLLALGFLGPQREGPIAELGVELDGRGNIAADANYMSSVPGVFACGDMRRGQSLVVWALWEGRECARGVDRLLVGRTYMPASPMNIGRAPRAGA